MRRFHAAASALVLAACATPPAPPATPPTPPATPSPTPPPDAPPSEPEEETAPPAMSPQAVNDVVRAHRAEIARCYERELLADPSLTGEVMLEFEIAGTGAVTRAQVEPQSTLRDPELEACLIALYLNLRFPSDRDRSTVVRYPLRFAPGSTP